MGNQLIWSDMWRFQRRAYNIHAPAIFSLFAMQSSHRITELKKSHISQVNHTDKITKLEFLSRCTNKRFNWNTEKL